MVQVYQGCKWTFEIVRLENKSYGRVTLNLRASDIELTGE
jgi:hypothetical protein